MGIYLGGIYRKKAASLLDQTAFSPAALRLSAIFPARLRQLFADLQPLDLYHQNRNEANGMLRTALGLYADYAPAPGLPDSPASSLLANAVFLIHSIFIMSTSHRTALSDARVSRSTLYRAFQSELNISPGNFIEFPHSSGMPPARARQFRQNSCCLLRLLGCFLLLPGIPPTYGRLTVRLPQAAAKQDAGSEYSRLVF